MRLHVDLETLELIEGPGFRNPVTSLRFKRGDAARLEVVFLAGGTTPDTIGDPALLELHFGVKPRGRYDIGYLVHSSAWAMPDPAPASPVYQCSPSFNTVELDSALGVGSATGTELAEITLMGEITWREGTGEPTSTRTFLVVVENDVNRGTEGVPESAEPPYPAPENVATTAAVAAAVAAHAAATDPHPKYLRHDVQESLTATQRGYVRGAIAAAEESPNPNTPMQKLSGSWWPEVHDGQPTNSQDQSSGGTPGWKGRLATDGTDAWICTEDNLSTGNDGWRKVATSVQLPPQSNYVYIDSWESFVSFGQLVAGQSYHVRFDNFSEIPQLNEFFGIANVSNGSLSNVQQVDGGGYINPMIDNAANFMASQYDTPSWPSDIYAEFTFTADTTFDWAGNSFYGSYGSGYWIYFNVTITPL